MSRGEITRTNQGKEKSEIIENHENSENVVNKEGKEGDFLEFREELVSSESRIEVEGARQWKGEKGHKRCTCVVSVDGVVECEYLGSVDGLAE